MIHVGIDLHTNNMVNVALNDNGEVVREAKLSTSGRALEDFFGTFTGTHPGRGRMHQQLVLAGRLVPSQRR